MWQGEPRPSTDVVDADVAWGEPRIAVYFRRFVCSATPRSLTEQRSLSLMAPPSMAPKTNKLESDPEGRGTGAYR